MSGLFEINDNKTQHEQMGKIFVMETASILANLTFLIWNEQISSFPTIIIFKILFDFIGQTKANLTRWGLTFKSPEILKCCRKSWYLC